jgi:hypothetical protein
MWLSWGSTLIKGRDRELARVDMVPNSNYTWDLAPNGSAIAIAKGSEGRIDILPLNGQAPYHL